MFAALMQLLHSPRRPELAFTLDPEVATALAPMAAAMTDVTPPPVGDVKSRRPVLEAIMAETASAQTMPTDVKSTDFHTTAVDGADVLLRWYAKQDATPGPAVLYLHGG